MYHLSMVYYVLSADIFNADRTETQEGTCGRKVLSSPRVGVILCEEFSRHHIISMFDIILIIGKTLFPFNVILCFQSSWYRGDSIYSIYSAEFWIIFTLPVGCHMFLVCGPSLFFSSDSDLFVNLSNLMQVFRARTPPEAIDLVSRLLEYTPSSRISPLQACAHNFFDELREPNTRLPNGRALPPLFNFTEQGKYSIRYTAMLS